MTVYNEAESSRRLIENNQKRIREEFSLRNKNHKRIKMLFELLLHGNVEQIRRQLKLIVFRRKYVNSKGNYSYNRCINEEQIALKRCSEVKAVVFTCLIGNIDSIKEPLFTNPCIDYVIFTDQEVPENSSWRRIDVRQWEEYGNLTSVQLSRKIKILSFRYLEGYDYSLYVDSTIQIVADMYPLICNMEDALLGIHTHAIRDCVYMEAEAVSFVKKADSESIKKQVNRYKREGFPKHYGLFQNSIIIKNERSKELQYLMKQWWEEYLLANTRDQLSLPYVLWKNGIPKEKVLVLGRNASTNPRFLIHNKTSDCHNKGGGC